MRTFIALNLPTEIRDELYAALDPLRQRGLPVRWAAPEALHLTLKFLGDIEGGEVTRLDETLATVAAKHARLELEVGAFGAFPSLRRASVLWVGVTATNPLMALQRDLELACSRLGYAREQRPFRPHITVGRTQSGSRPADVERLAASVDYRVRVGVETVDLMRSHLGGAGARYEALLRRPLGLTEP
jgi:RNA 2',3'-cyclic 3'-phosphodiesterase